MRTPTLAAIAAILASTGVGHAQPRVGQSPEARPGGRTAVHAGQPRVNLPGPRWGGKVRGRWYGGNYAPGGWAAYRMPVRGWVMPRYWVAPSFFIQDWPVYGLTRPQPGYGWYRYYDDAVLADRDGRVLDYRRGIDWDAGDNGRYVRDDRAYDRYTAGNEGPLQPPPPPPPVARRDDGVGGAVIGGVVGGVAGNVIAGRGNRLGGTLLGAGVGALAGTAIDRAEDRRAPPPPPPPPPAGRGYGADYPLPGDGVPVAPDDGYYDDAPGVVFGPMREEVQPIGPRPRPRGGYVERHVGAPPVARGYTTTTTTEGPGGYIANGYYYPPRTVTTVTIQNAPVTTTTTEEVVTYETHRAAPRRVYRSKTLRR